MRTLFCRHRSPRNAARLVRSGLKPKDSSPLNGQELRPVAHGNPNSCGNHLAGIEVNQVANRDGIPIISCKRVVRPCSPNKHRWPTRITRAKNSMSVTWTKAKMNITWQEGHRNALKRD